MDCPICCETFSGRNKQILCHHCNQGACASCTKRMLEESVNEPQCMFPDCKKVWDREFLCEKFSSTYVNVTYKKHRENVLVDRQMVFMEQTQQEINRLDEIERLRVSLMDDLTWSERSAVIDRIRVLENKEHKERREAFYGRCPKETCNGFVNNKFQCGICETKVCRKCRVEVSPDPEIRKEHECDPNLIQTLELMRKDCKPCPTCKVLINKYEGCDQAFCTECKTVFSWRTLQVVTNGPLHNPHYLDWVKRQRESGVNLQERRDDQVVAGRNYCFNFEGAYTFIELNRYIANLKGRAMLEEFVRVTNHLADVTIPRYNQELDYESGRFLKARIRFMRGEISRDRLKTLVQMAEKAIKKKQEIAMILDTFIEMVRSTIIQHLKLDGYSRPTQEQLTACLMKLFEIVEETNSLFWKIRKNYKNVTFGFRIPYLRRVENVKKPIENPNREQLLDQILEVVRLF